MTQVILGGRVELRGQWQKVSVQAGGVSPVVGNKCSVLMVPVSQQTIPVAEPELRLPFLGSCLSLLHESSCQFSELPLFQFEFSRDHIFSLQMRTTT